MAEDWLLKQVQQQQQAAVAFDQQAFYQELAAFIQEQQKRLDQAQGQLDGDLWDHSQW